MFSETKRIAARDFIQINSTANTFPIIVQFSRKANFKNTSGFFVFQSSAFLQKKYFKQKLYSDNSIVIKITTLV